MKRNTRQGDKFALLGKTENGDKVYLQKASYDCDWYFGFGYIAVFEKNRSEQSTHTHWDSYFTGSSHVQPEDITEKLAETPFSKKELWILCDLMKTFYSLKETSGVYNRGNSHLTGETHGMLKNEEMKQQVDRDTYKVIQKVQDLVGFEAPALIKSCPEHVKDLRDELKRGDL